MPEPAQGPWKPAEDIAPEYVPLLIALSHHLRETQGLVTGNQRHRTILHRAEELIRAEQQTNRFDPGTLTLSYYPLRTAFDRIFAHSGVPIISLHEDQNKTDVVALLGTARQLSGENSDTAPLLIRESFTPITSGLSQPDFDTETAYEVVNSLIDAFNLQEPQRVPEKMQHISAESSQEAIHTTLQTLRAWYISSMVNMTSDRSTFEVRIYQQHELHRASKVLLSSSRPSDTGAADGAGTE